MSFSESFRVKTTIEPARPAAALGRSFRARCTMLALVAGYALASPALAGDATEQHYLETVARGGENGALARELAARPRAARTPRASRSDVARNLHAALAEVRRLAAAPDSEDSKASSNRLEQAGARARAQDLLVRERFASIRRHLDNSGSNANALARLGAAERLYEERFGPVRAMLEAIAAEQSAGSTTRRAPVDRVVLERAIAALPVEPDAPLLRALALPFRAEKLAPRTPLFTPVVVPSYLQPSAPEPVAADLAPTVEAPLSEEIVARAASLGFDYVRIYEFVRNEIELERYGGSLKGAVETLRQK
ncbi:MAG: hypothetical protein ACREQY_23335, partial [Candidatus Binatia bacterium]